MKTASKSDATPAKDARLAAAQGWLQAKERSNAVALRLMCWIAVHLGRRVARWLLHPITLYFLMLAATPRRYSRRYLARVLERPARWSEVYQHFHTFATTVLDRIYFLRSQAQVLDVHVTSHEPLDITLADGRGAFLLGAHFGSFEVLSKVGKERPGMAVAMVMYPDNARKINAALQALAPDEPFHIIPLGRPESTLAIRDWLDQGGLGGILADRMLPSDSSRGAWVEVPFLGQLVRFSDGPFRLAALLRRRVIFMVGIYHGERQQRGQYEVRFEALADFSVRETDPGLRDAHIHRAIVAYAARLEVLCRAAPFNWFNFFDFWHDDIA